jgi:predicted dehydrogenase
MSEAVRKLRYAMVGGGEGAFIGAVHRKAMALDGQYELVAGALSSTPDKARASGRSLGLAVERTHPEWQSLLEDELRRDASTASTWS